MKTMFVTAMFSLFSDSIRMAIKAMDYMTVDLDLQKPKQNALFQQCAAFRLDLLTAQAKMHKAIGEVFEEAVK